MKREIEKARRTQRVKRLLASDYPPPVCKSVEVGMTAQTHLWLIEEAAGHGISPSTVIRRLLVDRFVG